jgi:hypothetical protein
MRRQDSNKSWEDDEDPDYLEWKRDIESRRQKILRAPAVVTNLKKLSAAGADEDKLLLGLAMAPSEDFSEIHRYIQDKKMALKRLAEHLESASSEMDRAFSSPLNFSIGWKALLLPFAATGFPNVEKLKQLPAGLTAAMRRFASALRVEERNLGRLIRLHPRLTDNDYLARIVSYIKESTGRFHDELLADLLQAAHDTLGSEKQFSAESLKKFRQRHARSLVRTRESPTLPSSI